jgi:hypothetical protein
VAQINGVAVLNLNAVANAVRPGTAAGDALRVALVKEGENPGQGVGYLADGSMVVVDQGAPHVGQTVDAVISNTVQTNAGRLVFARLMGSEPGTAAPAASADEGDAEPASRVGSMARAATAQPRTPPRTGREPGEGGSARNPRRG